MTIATKDNVPTKLDEDELINYAKVVILGASGVGKTSIIKVSWMKLSIYFIKGYLSEIRIK